MSRSAVFSVKNQCENVGLRSFTYARAISREKVSDEKCMRSCSFVERESAMFRFVEYFNTSYTIVQKFGQKYPSLLWNGKKF